MHQRSYAGCAFLLDVYKINTGCAKWPAEYFLAAKNETMLLTFMQSLFIITWYFWFHFPFHCILCNTHVICIIRTTRQIFGIYFFAVSYLANSCGWTNGGGGSYVISLSRCLSISLVYCYGRCRRWSLGANGGLWWSFTRQEVWQFSGSNIF